MKTFCGFMLALSALLCAALFAYSPSHGASTLPSQIQIPCRVAGHTQEQACVIIQKGVSGDNPGQQSVPFNTRTAAALAGRFQTFSVIWVYHVIPGGLNADAGVSVDFNKGGISADLYSGKPRPFWVTTRDGGKTWSHVQTTNMAGALVY